MPTPDGFNFSLSFLFLPLRSHWRLGIKPRANFGRVVGRKPMPCSNGMYNMCIRQLKITDSITNVMYTRPATMTGEALPAPPPIRSCKHANLCREIALQMTTSVEIDDANVIYFVEIDEANINTFLEHDDAHV